MKNRLFILLTLIISLSLPAYAEPLIKVVAMVNNDAVTSYQLEKRLAAAMAVDTEHRKLSSDEHRALKLKTLESMIEELLVEQRVRELKLSVSERDIDSAIEDVQRQNKLNREQLKTALQAQGMSFADYRQKLRKEMLRYKLIGQEVRSKVEVTKAQIRDYFEQHQDDYKQPPTIRLGRISYPVPKDSNDTDKMKLTQQAQVARQLLLNGKPYAEVLESLGTEVEGGDMGDMIEAEMNPELLEAVKGLKQGEVSEPKEALGSIHIFQVLERAPEKVELTEEISKEIKNILAEKNSEARFSEWKKELRKDATIDIRI